MSQTQKLLFLPPNGTDYQEDDWKILCKSTPIPLEQIPRYLIDESRTPGWLRPCVSCCWAVGQDKLLELAQTRYPDSIFTDDEGRVGIDTIFYMLADINDEFNIPDEMEDCVQIIETFNAESEIVYALAVGNNFMGILPLDIIDRISNTLFATEKPQWYLYVSGWRWRRKAPLRHHLADVRYSTKPTMPHGVAVAA